MVFGRARVVVPTACHRSCRIAFSKIDHGRQTQATTLVKAPPAKRSTRSSATNVSPASAAPAPETKPTRKAKTTKTATKAKAATASTKATPETPETTLTPAAIKEEEDFQRKLDDHYSTRYGSGAIVVGAHDVMLNQVEIKATTSKNKFYRLQLLSYPGTERYDVWTRWGRVGEDGDYMLLAKGASWDLGTATAAFEKKFKDKTKNVWANRASFGPKKGSYEIIELDAKATAATTTGSVGSDTAPSSLPLPTQHLLRMIFDTNMFKDALSQMNLDPARMPLGTLSASQIAKGVAILESLQARTDGSIAELSSKFYQLIPHAFSRSSIPPLLKSPDQIAAKFEMLSTLHDIVVAQDVQKAASASAPTTAVNQIDLNYAELHADISLVDAASPEHATLLEYIAQTRGGNGMDVAGIWAVKRSTEDARFAPFQDVDNHRLLWHGTNVAVVAAILKSGLRIMPSSGGRVGKGIYLANMLAKSRSYVSPANYNGERLGCVFLVEAALGRMHEITQDDSSLKRAPDGFDSVLAKGNVHPDPAYDRTLDFDGRAVTVNCGPQVQSEVSSSSFYHDEYLVYREEQQRLRYIVTFKM
ncbi:hypothetical protein SDRG_12368 [Saprolegnia diclina VS20]|uniref:Poly [ADP-ribose] polymerase n=1 Tax=Saprolegnia diclina (strain VS20) TaxID=1156394 RepID=T0RIV7_SAPDV|nr:hypothetical protein SDRG_12368 [Saprolegnia diclina VS20]EQC29822.1 hypothetical protein SDRG_12368 [Saprolegnia diclina VS20]|eukprot:XP_008616661.1 hypothetical protein SDRG_12368 [Saprolegnia diclina VS20]